MRSRARVILTDRPYYPNHVREKKDANLLTVCSTACYIISTNLEIRKLEVDIDEARFGSRGKDL